RAPSTSPSACRRSPRTPSTATERGRVGPPRIRARALELAILVSPVAELDQLDLVAVRIFDEGDLRAAVLHRARLADDLGPLAPELVAGLVDVVDAERDVPGGGGGLGVPVVRELDHGVIALVTVADEGQCESPAGIVVPTEKPHAQHVAVEAERALEVSDPEHRMEHPHVADSSAQNGAAKARYRR